MINKYSILNGLKSFSLDGSKNDLVFQLIFSYFAFKNGKLGSWYSKRISEESIIPTSTSDNSFDPEINYNYGKRKAKFKGICLKQDSVSFIPGNVVNLNTSYKLDTLLRDLNTDFVLGNCLFRAVK